MTQRALFAVAGFLGICLSVSAQQPQSPEQIQSEGLALNRPYPNLQPLSLADREFFFFSTAFGEMRPTTDFLPPFNPIGTQNYYSPISPSRRNALNNSVENSSVEMRQAADPIRFGGEMGVLYGRSSGKYGREDFQTYIIGTVGTEKFSITAGFLHQESNGRGPYYRRQSSSTVLR
ncbi:MAG: hypothetical protein QOH88_3386 [Verrucomicrobiota bacterium]|jgi:hypothetical protein